MRTPWRARSARRLTGDQRFDEAARVLDNAVASLPANPLTEDLINDLNEEKADLLLAKSRHLMRMGDTRGGRPLSLPAVPNPKGNEVHT